MISRVFQPTARVASSTRAVTELSKSLAAKVAPPARRPPESWRSPETDQEIAARIAEVSCQPPASAFIVPAPVIAVSVAVACRASEAEAPSCTPPSSCAPTAEATVVVPDHACVPPVAKFTVAPLATSTLASTAPPMVAAASEKPIDSPPAPAAGARSGRTEAS